MPDDYKNWLTNNKDFEPDDYALTYVDPQHGRECVTGLGEFYTFSPDGNTQYPKIVESFHTDEHGISVSLKELEDIHLSKHAQTTAPTADLSSVVALAVTLATYGTRAVASTVAFGCFPQHH